MQVNICAVLFTLNGNGMYCEDCAECGLPIFAMGSPKLKCLKWAGFRLELIFFLSSGTLRENQDAQLGGEKKAVGD